MVKWSNGSEEEGEGEGLGGRAITTFVAYVVLFRVRDRVAEIDGVVGEERERLRLRRGVNGGGRWSASERVTERKILIAYLRIADSVSGENEIYT